MPAYTSTTSGRFSAGSTWVGGVAPSADGDTWTIASGHTVDYDFDNSGHASGWGNCTVTGTLRAYGQLAISNDGNGTISSMAGITGLTPLFMTSNKVYPSVVDDGGGAWHIDIYKESGRSTKIAHTGNITGNGDYALTADSSSGVGGTITVANFATIAADTDIIASGYFYCRMNGAISGAGSVLAGTAGTAYPGHLFIRFEETKTSGDLFTATSLTLALYCDQPTILSTTLSGAEAAGQTALSVATDLTADAAHWIKDAMVRIDDISSTLPDSEERVIDSISATELTVTAGLTNAKVSGALVYLISRNVSILGPSSTQANGINGGTNEVIRASVRRFNSGIYGGTGHTNSGTISGCTYGINFGSGNTNSGTISGCSTGINAGSGNTNSGTISGCTSGINAGSGNTNSGTISGCTYGINYGAGNTNSGTISGCSTGINAGAVMLQRGSVISGNSTADIVMPAVVYGYGARLQSATPVSAYTTVSGTQSQNVTMLYDFADSSNNPQVGYYKCWMQSGVIVTAAATVGGPTLSHAHTFANAQDHLRLDLPLRLIAGIPYKWTIQVKAAQAPNGMTLRPTFAICDPHRIVYHASEILASVAVPNDTSTAWQTVTLAYTPTETREYTFRATGQNASGSFEWWSTDVVPTYPAAADVQAGASAYGPTGSEYTPSYPTTATTQAAQIATDQAGAPANLRTPATSIGGVAGTLDVAEDNVSGII